MLAAPASVRAHGVRVDGDPTDWFLRAPNSVNVGLVARDAMSTGELIWRDAPRDTRTDFTSPETGADLQTFAVTADATNLYFRVVLGPESSVITNPVQIQIAIDVDRTSGSGNTPFAGFADTDVAPEAAWERLIQTQGGTSGTVRVRDTSYTVIGMGTMATNPTTAVTEIAIPWTLLPAGPSHDVLRFSVAIFRENLMGDTLDVMGTSDALDVLTDYGAPPSAMTNTFAEVSDGVVNHSVDVYFGGTGREPYAPLLITRFLSDAPAAGGATEWIEVRNQTPGTLDLSQFALGDEETPAGAEEMARFPAGSTLASGAVAVLAGSGAAFLAQYGANADYELFPGTSAAVPDVSRLTSWSSNMGAVHNLALGNTGDEILALGWNRTIVDVVTYGTGTYPDVTQRTAPAASRIAARSPVTQDTDNCATDFPLTLDDCGPGAGTCTTCRACVRFACTIDAGAACDDGDACTTGTTCSATGTCGSGTPVSCDDGNPCTTDTCASATGCSNTINAGALCDDGSACTTGDVCSATGVCGGSAVTCDDMNPCTDDTCAPATGCAYTPVVGRACSDGDACTTGEACTAAGTCGGGSPVTCMEDANPCTTAVCTAGTGCGFVNNTAACDDGDACTTGDVCGGGICAGTPRSCDDMNPCTADACAAGACTHTPTVGVACDDGNACTMGDACDARGTCAGTPSCDAGGTMPDAATADAFVPDDDAGMMADDDAGMTADDDAGAMVGDDAGAMVGDDAGMTTGTDAGASDAGRGDAGRGDAGSGAMDAGMVMPPSSAGSCSCRAAGIGHRAPLAAFGVLALLGLVLRRDKRR
ncbi:MAG: hypothetical protein OHK0013_22630 [Sandaracinaceae bacterium]